MQELLLAIGGAVGGSHDPPSPYLAGAMSVLLAACAAYAVRAYFLSPADRPRWGKRGNGPPLTRVGAVAWAFIAASWSAVLALSACGANPGIVGFRVLMVATVGTFLALLHDHWASDGYRIR